MSGEKDLAYNDYLAGMKYKDIAEKYRVSLSAVKSWATRDWKKGSEKKSRMQPKKTATEKKSQSHKAETRLEALMVVSVEQNTELTDKERFFCLSYVQIFNASQAARNAGYEARNARWIGYELLTKPHVRAEVDRLKTIKAQSLLASQDDVVERYMRIAFADITDFVDFFTEEVPVVINGEVATTKDAVTGVLIPVTRSVNTVRFKDARMVDGGLIAEISQGKDSAKIKLEDRQKALDWLSRYFLMNPLDQHKVEYDNARLAIEQQKADSGAAGDQPIEITINYGGESKLTGGESDED